MQNLIDQLLSGNGKMLLGVVAVLLAVFAPQIWEKLKPYIPSFGSSSASVEDTEDIHATIISLAEYFKEHKDLEGVKIAARLGNHVYEQYINDILANPAPVPNTEK